MSTLTRNDQVMAAADDPFDLADVTPPLAKLMQPGTPELPPRVAGATVGGFVIPDARSDEPLVYDGLQGFLMQSVVVLLRRCRMGAYGRSARRFAPRSAGRREVV